jgi:hypothetical protein
MRVLSALALAALTAPTVTQRWIVRVTLPSGTFGASDGPDFFTWQGVEYVPLAEALRVTIPSVQAANQNQGAVVQLSATDPAILAVFLAEPYRAAPTQISLLLFENGVPGEEFLKWDGLGDQIVFDDEPAKLPTGKGKDDQQPQQSTLSFKVAPRTVDMKRVNGRWATNVDQQLFRDPDDTFLQDVALVGVSTINWGQSGSSAPAFSATNASVGGAPSGVAGLMGKLFGLSGLGPAGLNGQI